MPKRKVLGPSPAHLTLKPRKHRRDVASFIPRLSKSPCLGKTKLTSWDSSPTVAQSGGKKYVDDLLVDGGGEDGEGDSEVEVKVFDTATKPRSAVVAVAEGGTGRQGRRVRFGRDKRRNIIRMCGWIDACTRRDM